jgi:chemotaxis protein MotB
MLAKAIEGEVAKTVLAAGLISLPDITVKGTPEGVLISLTDKENFEMFRISSAKPRPEVVVVMEKIAKVLEHQKGGIIIRGHTDGRPFRSKTYDNWRLSTARAHISYHMLVRAGVKKSRVERIEGHADRSLKVPGNPRAAENRRIEILLRPAKT